MSIGLALSFDFDIRMTGRILRLEKITVRSFVMLTIYEMYVGPLCMCVCIYGLNVLTAFKCELWSYFCAVCLEDGCDTFL
jgi:hypothetical protein